jgi:hypothetical protein
VGQPLITALAALGGAIIGAGAVIWTTDGYLTTRLPAEMQGSVADG